MVRAEADDLLDRAMEELQVLTAKRRLIYRAVRLFGSFAWDNNKKDKDGGAKRVLKKFPPQAAITWDEWRQHPDVLE